MNDFQELIAQYFHLNAEREWQRLERHRMEFEITMRALGQHLPPPPARILDCGGGPGRYAVELSKMGYVVTLADLSAKNLKLAKRKSKQRGVNLHSVLCTNALALPYSDEELFDVVLLMGPLYHLLDVQRRQSAIEETFRVLKPGGVLVAGFVGRFAPIRDIAQNRPQLLVEQPEFYHQIFDTGFFHSGGHSKGEFVACFAHPDEVADLFWEQGFEVVGVYGVEGMLALIEEQVNQLEGEAWEAWVAMNFKVSQETSLLGCNEHLLVVSLKPAWRHVLRLIASRLEQERISYKIVAGASVALQGLRSPVKDIDIEVSAEDAYRFESVFSDYVLQPVSLSHTNEFRSHYGKFLINGVNIDVMGDIHRREKGNWVPSSTKTSQEVLVGEQKVNVSWLEEEIIAYIRRGRLDRAAKCLHICDAERMLSILKGFQEIGVL